MGAGQKLLSGLPPSLKILVLLATVNSYLVNFTICCTDKNKQAEFYESFIHLCLLLKLANIATTYLDIW